MARTVTLTNLLSQIRYLGNLQGMAGRHPDSDLTRAINQSIQHFREKVSSHGVRSYLVSTTGTLAVGQTSPYAYTELDLSAKSPAIVRVFGLDITVQGRVVPLEQIDFDSRNDFQDWGVTSATREPVAYANVSQYKLALFPASNAAYAYTCWYLPVLADLSAGSDTFDGVVGWEEWVVWDVLLKVLQRDEYAAIVAQATAERDRVWADIERNCNPTKSGGMVRRVDSRALRTDRIMRRVSWWNQ